MTKAPRRIMNTMGLLRKMGSVFLFILLLTGGTSNAVSSAMLGKSTSEQKRRINPPNPSKSSPFLPATLEIKSEKQLKLFRSIISRLRTDSTRHWELRGDRLRVSYDLMTDLTGGNLPITEGGLSHRLALFLTRNHGTEFRATGSAWGTYLPNDGLLMTAPQWTVHNTGAPFGLRPGKVGADINIEKVWDKFSGSDSLIVAVIDAGFDFSHPDLKGRNWVNQAEAKGKPGVDDDRNGYVDDSLGWDFVGNDNFPQDRNGHGTSVSSVIAAGFDNNQGIAGILAQGKIMPVRVLDASGNGDQNQIAKGILYAVRNGATVINFSIGGDGDNIAMRSAFLTAREQGIPIVVAAGNDGRNLDSQAVYPAAYNLDNMVVVGAHDHAGSYSAFSNFGSTLPHVSAPGEFIAVCSQPNPVVTWWEGFELQNPHWTLSSGGFALSTSNPLEGKQSLLWVARNNDTAGALDEIDLSTLEGGILNFSIEFKPANKYDILIVEANRTGSNVWTEIALIGSTFQPAVSLAFGLQELDGSRFKLRFRTALASHHSSAGRILKIDAIGVTVPNLNPPAEGAYSVIGGTSLAAPHVSAYVALQKLACDRTGLAWSRALALTGITPDPSLVGKVSSGGRLNAYKGLEFYLSTLPDFLVFDSTANSWKAGEKVEYFLSINPSNSQGYQYSELGLPAGASINNAGLLTWFPTSSQTGPHTLRLIAEGPTTMRKQISFSVEGGAPVALERHALEAQISFNRNGQTFYLKPEHLQGRHWVEVFGTDVSGKVQLLNREYVDGATILKSTVGLIPLTAATKPIHRLQIRVDGILLPSGR